MNFKRLSAFLLIAIMSISGTAFANNNSKNTPATASTIGTSKTTDDTIVLDGEVGDVFVFEGVTFEIVEDVKVIPPSINRASKNGYETINFSSNSQTSTHHFSLGNGYNFWKIFTNNTQSSSEHTIISITTGSPSGATVAGPYTLTGGKNWTSYSTKGSVWSDGTYYVNYTSGKAYLSGSTGCRIANTFEELDI